ncbi:hypothetical protein [Arthrobacter psychrolactophilus]
MVAAGAVDEAGIGSWTTDSEVAVAVADAVAVGSESPGCAAAPDTAVTARVTATASAMGSLARGEAEATLAAKIGRNCFIWATFKM